MALMTVDVNDMVGVNAAAFRVLSDNLGDDATRAFISQFKNSSIRDTGERPRVAASQLADILENARAEAETGRGKGNGDATKEKYERPQMTFEEMSKRIMAADAAEKARLAGESGCMF